MRKNILLLILIFTTSLLYSQEPNAEIIEYKVKCRVLSKNKYELTKYKLLRINNRDGREYAVENIYSKQGGKLEITKALILDQNKEKVRKIKKKEIKEREGSSTYFHTDALRKKINAYHDVYPYYFELEYKEIKTDWVSLPLWSPQSWKNINCLYSSYELEVPQDFRFHHKFYNFTPEETFTRSEDYYYYKWETTESILAFEKSMEGYSTFYDIFPRGVFLPESFVFSEIEGGMKSWKEFGDWYSRLTESLDELPESEKSEINELVKGVTDDREKIRLLYHYLQENTRYVNVSVGLGGMIPHAAKYVSENQYGDCKALTNYMKALLKAVNIKSYFALINAGDDMILRDTSFVDDYFNHVVLCIPMQTDTLWLENTTQELPFGYWGTFTNGKYALVCNFQNSKIIKTPSFKHNQNATYFTAKVKIQDQQLSVNLKTKLYGDKFETAIYSTRNKSPEEILEKSQYYFHYSQYKVSSINYQRDSLDPFLITQNATLIIDKHIQEFNDNLIILPVFSPFSLKNKLPTKQGLKIFIPFNEEVIDSVYYFIPEGYELASFPEPASLSSEFATINIDYQVQENSILCVNKIQINKGLFPPEKYSSLKKYLKKVKKIRNKSILLKRKQ